MMQMLQALAVTIVFLVTSQAHAARSDVNDLEQDSGFHFFDDVNDAKVEGAKLAKAVEEARLMRLREDVMAFRNWLTQTSHSTDEVEKRFKPSGFLGSRGKRFIPSLEPLLLARYYKDEEKWKRQPHLGFHGSRG